MNHELTALWEMRKVRSGLIAVRIGLSMSLVYDPTNEATRWLIHQQTGRMCRRSFLLFWRKCSGLYRLGATISNGLFNPIEWCSFESRPQCRGCQIIICLIIP
jgi:hypothetical protein